MGRIFRIVVNCKERKGRGAVLLAKAQKREVIKPLSARRTRRFYLAKARRRKESLTAKNAKSSQNKPLRSLRSLRL